MKRPSYVDKDGNTIDYSFKNRKKALYIFIIIGNIIPLILIGLIIYTMIDNQKCDTIYKELKKATLNYLKEKSELPSMEGEDVTISVDNLYNEKYLSKSKTGGVSCSGEVKTTKYKREYIYTLHLNNCNLCTTDDRYGNWSNEISYYPRNKSIIDVIPYYNYFDRQTVVTDWSVYFEQDELEKQKSKYGIRMPKKELMQRMPKVPEEGSIVEVQQEAKLNYRYKDKRWLWYDVEGNYSEFSSEKPSGFEKRDDSTKIYTKWTKYDLTHPDEKPYREITQTTGYQYYYEKDGKKIYANNKNYVASEEIDQKKYPHRENKSAIMYRYRDAKWRWYNGEKRRYSSFSATKPETYNFRDDDTEQESNYSSWSDESKINKANTIYRTEETKKLTRFRYLYEILSDPVLETSLTKEEFLQDTGMFPSEFTLQDNYKLDITYKFKYRKRR